MHAPVWKHVLWTNFYFELLLFTNHWSEMCGQQVLYTREVGLHVYMHLLHQWFVATNICETVVFAILVDYISRIEAILNLFDSKYRDREGVYTAIMNNEYVQYIIPSLS